MKIKNAIFKATMSMMSQMKRRQESRLLVNGHLTFVTKTGPRRDKFAAWLRKLTRLDSRVAVKTAAHRVSSTERHVRELSNGNWNPKSRKFKVLKPPRMRKSKRRLPWKRVLRKNGHELPSRRLGALDIGLA
jgi:hypothetical protein